MTANSQTLQRIIEARKQDTRTALDCIVDRVNALVKLEQSGVALFGLQAELWAIDDQLSDVLSHANRSVRR